MKAILSLLFALTLGTAFGQFIPQPMGYNPDVDGDELIGSTDLMSLLTLYGNTYDNGDSVEVGAFTLTEGLDTLTIPENLDLVYIDLPPHEPVSGGVHKVCRLPGGAGFKVMQVLVNRELNGTYNGYISIDFVRDSFDLSDVDSIYGSDWVTGSPIHNPTFFTVIRGHNGVWYGGAAL